MLEVISKEERTAFVKVMDQLKYNAKTLDNLKALKNVGDLYKELYPARPKDWWMNKEAVK